MNSLPFISHKLFVAAIGNEGRARQRPTRQERPSGGAADAASAMALEVMQDREPWPTGTMHPMRAFVVQAQS
jgi:hypothetical protein